MSELPKMICDARTVVKRLKGIEAQLTIIFLMHKMPLAVQKHFRFDLAEGETMSEVKMLIGKLERVDEIV